MWLRGTYSAMRYGPVPIAVILVSVRLLARAGIGSKRYYAVPLHRQPAMASFAPAGPLPGTDEAARTHLAIPMSPVLERAQADEVVAAVRDADLG